VHYRKRASIVAGLAIAILAVVLLFTLKWPWRSGQTLMTFNQPVNSVSFSRDANQIFAVYWANSLAVADLQWQPHSMTHFCSIWDLKSGRRLRTEYRDDATGNRHDGMYVTTDGMCMISWLRATILYDSNLSETAVQMHRGWEAISPISCFQETGRVALIGEDETIRYSSVVGGALQPWNATPPVKGVTSLAFGTSDSEVLLGTRDGMIMQCQLNPFVEKFRLFVPGSDSVDYIARLGSESAAVTCESGLIFIANFHTGSVQRVRSHDVNRKYCRIAASTSGSEFAAGFDHKATGRTGVTAFDRAGHELVTTMTASTVTCISYSVNGSAIAVGLEGGGISIWR
jgi:WD40 repeat protein